MTFKSVENINDLKIGEIIRSRSKELTYIVTANYGTRVTAVRTADVTNAIEWEVLRSEHTSKE